MEHNPVVNCIFFLSQIIYMKILPIFSLRAMHVFIYLHHERPDAKVQTAKNDFIVSITIIHLEY